MRLVKLINKLYALLEEKLQVKHQLGDIVLPSFTLQIKDTDSSIDMIQILADITIVDEQSKHRALEDWVGDNIKVDIINNDCVVYTGKVFKQVIKIRALQTRPED